MKIEHIGEFIRIAETMSYKQAAKELFVSQSNLSTHISDMEKELGFTLFDRKSGTHAKLSFAGAIFLGYAQELVSVYEEAVEESLAGAKGPQPLRIGFASFNAELVSKFEAIEGANLQFVMLESDQMPFKALLDDTVDIALVCDFSYTPSVIERAEASGIGYATIGNTPVVIALQADHPLAHKDQVCKADLKGYRILNAFPHLLMWSDTLNNMLGPEVSLKTSLRPLLQDPAELKRCDLGTDLFFGDPTAVANHFEKRDNIVVIDTLTDCVMETGISMAYRLDDFDERYQKILDAFGVN